MLRKLCKMINNIPNDVLNNLKQVSDEEYHAKECPYLSSSDFKKIYSKSYKDWEFDEKNQSEPSDNMILGSATHTSYLEKKDFFNKFALMPDFKPTDGKEYQNFKNSTNYKEQLAEFNSNVGEKKVLTIENFNLIQDIIIDLENSCWDKIVRNKFSIYENALYRSINGIQHKAKFDILTIIDGRLSIVDLKTTRSKNEAEFKKDFYYLDYDLQAYFYKLVLSQFTNEPIDFYFLVARNFLPTSTCLYKISSKSLEGGKEKYHTALDRLLTKDINSGLRGEREIIYL